MVANFEAAFKFPFKDSKWLVKLLIGGLLMCIPIVNFLVFGYLLKILQDAKDKKEATLPEWTDWGVLFQEGFMAFVVGLCYGLILVLLGILGNIPIVGCFIAIIQIAAGFLWGPVVAVALCFYLENKDLSAAFNFKGILDKIKANIVDYLIISLVLGVLSMISVITLILAIFIWFYLWVVELRLFGELFSAEKTS